MVEEIDSTILAPFSQSFPFISRFVALYRVFGTREESTVGSTGTGGRTNHLAEEVGGNVWGAVSRVALSELCMHCS